MRQWCGLQAETLVQRIHLLGWEVPMPPKTELTPLKAIRLKCLDCCLDQAHEVRLCPTRECPVDPYRFGRRPRARTGYLMSTLKAIRARCLDCSGGSTKDARDCTFTGCSLRPYRMGRNPNRAGIGGKPPSNRGTAGPGVSRYPGRERQAADRGVSRGFRAGTACCETFPVRLRCSRCVLCPGTLVLPLRAVGRCS